MERQRISSPAALPVADYSAIVDSAAPRRDSLGLGVDQSAGVWRALDRAATTIVNAGQRQVDSVRHRDKLITQVAVATAAVRRAVRRTSDGGNGSTPVDREILDALKREFVRELRLESTIDGRHVVRVLLAFESVEETNAAASRKAASTGFGLEALVEVAHDMRSPLTSILFLVDAIRTSKSGPITPVQERQLGLIYGAALGLSTLTSDLVDLVRGGLGLVEGPPAPFSMCEVLSGVRDIVKPIAEEKGLRLEFNSPPNDGRVGYAAALSRVLLNLTTNAVKFTQAGYVSIECKELSQTRLRFTVTDSGSGLPQDVRRSLFSAFTHTRGRMRFSNSGLGLSICRSLLRSMGSELHVETSSDQGSRFSFDLALPAADAP